MDIIYLGPSESVNVGSYGDHRKGQLKQYPDDFGADLIATSIKNRFEAVPTEQEQQKDAEVSAIMEEITSRFPAKKKRKK